MNVPYAFFIAVISILSLGLVVGDTFFFTDPNVITIIHYIDTGICVVFFSDFLYQLYYAPNRWKYFYTWGWVDLLSSVPMVDQLRAGRLIRLYRLIRVLRCIKTLNILMQFFVHKKVTNVFVVATLLTLVTVAISSIAILVFENSPDSNIKTGEDALWWAYVTITTVGYGDRFPITTEGRILGAILMTIGVGMFGIFSGIVASWCIQPTETKQDIELVDIQAEVKELKLLIEQLTNQLEYININGNKADLQRNIL